jgi:hypothetical protein
VLEGDNVCYCYGVVAFASFVLDLGGDGDTIEVTHYPRSIVVGFGERDVADVAFRCSWLVAHGVLDPQRSSTQLSALVEYTLNALVLFDTSVLPAHVVNKSPESVQIMLCFPLSFHIYPSRRSVHWIHELSV